MQLARQTQLLPCCGCLMGRVLLSAALCYASCQSQVLQQCGLPSDQHTANTDLRAQIIVFLYLLDNYPSFVVLASSGIGLLMTSDPALESC